MRVGVARRGVELLLVGVGLAEPQILLDRAVEQVGVLVHDGDHPAHRLGVERLQIAPADQHRPCCGSKRRSSRRATEDLPEPLGPTMPIFSPAPTVKESPSWAAPRPPG